MMRKVTRLVLVAFLLQITNASNFLVVAQTRQPASATANARQYKEELKQFDDFVALQMKLDKTPGLTIGFIKDDVVWVKGYGFADLENKLPAKSDSAYRLASVTKSMTAVAIMQLVEKKKINLDAEVQTYVPYFPKKPWPVTVRQLLGHLGGISHYKNADQETRIKEHKSTREAIAIFQDFDLVAEPGTRYSYSSYGYNLLGAIVEAASGMPYGEYMKQNVWGPAGMTDTRMDDPQDLIPNRVRGYRLVNGEIKNSEFVDISSRFAAGGTRSTVPDLLKYARSIMEGRLLSSESTIAATTSMSTRDGRLTNYAMGWDTTPFGGRYMLDHSGGQQETTTLLYVLPTRKLALAIGMNFEGGNPAVYLDRLFQLVTGTPLQLQFYSADQTKSSLVEAVNNTFSYGLAYFDHFRRPMTVDASELAKAFAYFNESVDLNKIKANPQEAKKKIREGVHPVGQQAFTKVGSYMAAKLVEKYGPAKLDSYVALGALVFLDDYLALAKTDPSIAKNFQPNEELRTVLAELTRDWRKTDTEYVRRLALTTATDLDLVGKNLRESFTGATVYPNLIDGLFAVTRQSLLAHDQARALKASRLAFDLYPEAPAANLSYGVALVLTGDSAGGQERLRKAASLNPTGAASAGGLNNVAYQLASVGLVDEALALLRAAIELYPKEANLYDSMGEFQLRKGDKVNALDSYRKALEINPNFPNAATAREVVKKLSGN
ncbi:MAG TPA: serine hydrolase [Pyrinomonadaceae bacterium]|nr:serine hydrolase [Pyrinomonadaceae bacterium]